MKKMIAILMILIPLAALSQAKKSDTFYYKGFELINAKKYMEAISHYEKCSLLDKEDYDISEGANYYRSEEKIIECYEALAEEYFAKYNFDKALRYSRLKLNLTKKNFWRKRPRFRSEFGGTCNYQFRLWQQFRGSGIAIGSRKNLQKTLWRK